MQYVIKTSSPTPTSGVTVTLHLTLRPTTYKSYVKRYQGGQFYLFGLLLGVKLKALNTWAVSPV